MISNHVLCLFFSIRGRVYSMVYLIVGLFRLSCSEISQSSIEGGLFTTLFLDVLGAWLNNLVLVRLSRVNMLYRLSTVKCFLVMRWYLIFVHIIVLKLSRIRSSWESVPCCAACDLLHIIFIHHKKLAEILDCLLAPLPIQSAFRGLPATDSHFLFPLLLFFWVSQSTFHLLS